MEKEHLIFGIRAIIEVIQAGKKVGKLFRKREFLFFNKIKHL